MNCELRVNREVFFSVFKPSPANKKKVRFLGFPTLFDSFIRSSLRREVQRRIIRISINMSAVNITNVTVLDNPASFITPFQFEISYECLAALKDGNFFSLSSFRVSSSSLFPTTIPLQMSSNPHSLTT